MEKLDWHGLAMELHKTGATIAEIRETLREKLSLDISRQCVWNYLKRHEEETKPAAKPTVVQNNIPK